MRRLLLLVCFPLTLFAEEPITRLACGSCYKPTKDSGIWETIAAGKPQLFLFMGDNIYADTSDMAVMRKKYAALLKQPGYAALRQQTKVLPMWDDHDYGKNDAGADYKMREESQQIFLDTFAFPKNHPARSTPGVYHSWRGGPAGKRLQIILLDTRYFRSPIPKKKDAPDPKATILGDAQWKWLEAELRKRADLRIIVSSIQVLTTEHRFEKWANFSAERQRLLALLKTSKTKRVVLLSGDRHLAEHARLGKDESGLPYDLIEMTTSGMTHAGAPNDPNRLRVGEIWNKLNYGTLEIDWGGRVPVVGLKVRGKDGVAVREQRVTFLK